MRTKLHDELAATVEEVYKLWCNSAQTRRVQRFEDDCWRQSLRR